MSTPVKPTDPVGSVVSAATGGQSAWVGLVVALGVGAMAVLLAFLQKNAEQPTVVHNAIPTPEQDKIVGDAIVADIVAGRVPLVGG